MYFYKNSGLNFYKTAKAKNSSTGLRYLVNYHRICCVSYLGSQIDQNKHNYFLKFILILWNLAFLVYSSYVSNKTIVKRMENLFAKNFDSSKSKVIFIVLFLGSSAFFIQGFILNILLLFRGRKILDLMKSQTLVYIEDKSEKKIGFFVTSIQFLYSFMTQLLSAFFFYDIIIKSFGPFSIKPFLHDLIFFFLIFNSQTTIIALIAYQSYIVSKQLTNISNNFSHSNLQDIYQFVCKTDKFIKKLDELISIFIFLAITITTTICLSFLCMLAIDPKKYLFICIPTLLENFTLLICTCLICDIIPKNFNKFYDKLEESLSESFFTNKLDYLYQNSLLTKINAIKQEIGFTAFNLFKVNTNTIISCLAFILSYSIILIQTSNEK